MGVGKGAVRVPLQDCATIEEKRVNLLDFMLHLFPFFFLSEAFSDFRPFSRFCRRDIVEELLAGWRGDWWSDGGGALFAYNEKIRFSSNFRVHPSRF